ncbi:hypothetical protein PR048_013860 [Dryococelus australis]|uniref:Retrovirus-related Pol polyprotein from transposon TNT 1-94-like beta-barrel domain-containing protein n=1 Tax=Dryococelus australis TaxID=614101 RepID=A0ABQ9HTB6_9NEOP|nr:hypothetical protein PR048_013860 [Dryococelus australis]
MQNVHNNGFRLNWSAPQEPWERIHLDLFHFNSVEYFILCEAYSKWVECFVLPIDTKPYRHFVTAWESVSTKDQKLSELTAHLKIEEERVSGKGSHENALFSQRQGKPNQVKCYSCGKPGTAKSWYIDSGGSEHMYAQRNLFSYSGTLDQEKQIMIGHVSTLVDDGIGTVRIEAFDGD